MYKIICINPGSTSTKIALFSDEKVLHSTSIVHNSDELAHLLTLEEQFEYRFRVIINWLNASNIDLKSISAVVARGGIIRPIKSGVYRVNEKMYAELISKKKCEHASDLGALLAYKISQQTLGASAYIADPVVVDELDDVAKISGIAGIERRSLFHALNQKATARKYAMSVGVSYADLNLVIAHLGGGISVAAHRKGSCVDVNQALNGYGPFSPERAGTVDAGQIVDMCFDNKYTKEQIKQLLVSEGGLKSYFGTNDVQLLEKRIESGDAYVELVLSAMAYQVGKEIAAMMAVLHFNVDAVILTGGIAYSEFVVQYIKKMISPVVKLIVLPGENELESLALSGLRVLRGEPSLDY